MKTTLIVAFCAAAFSVVTLAAFGKPMPFLAPADVTPPPANATYADLPAAFHHFDHQ